MYLLIFTILWLLPWASWGQVILNVWIKEPLGKETFIIFLSGWVSEQFIITTNTNVLISIKVNSLNRDVGICAVALSFFLVSVHWTLCACVSRIGEVLAGLRQWTESRNLTISWNTWDVQTTKWSHWGCCLEVNTQANKRDRGKTKIRGLMSLVCTEPCLHWAHLGMKRQMVTKARKEIGMWLSALERRVTCESSVRQTPSDMILKYISLPFPRIRLKKNWNITPRRQREINNGFPPQKDALESPKEGHRGGE